MTARRRARPAETILLTFTTLLFWLSVVALSALVRGRTYEFLDPEDAWRVWLIAGWAAPVTLIPATVMWGRRIWRMRGAEPGPAALLVLAALAIVTATPILSAIELRQAGDIRELVAAEGRVGPYTFNYWPQDGTIGIAGGIGPGFADDLKRAIAQHPDFTRIVITSSGGLVSEAMASARILRGHPGVAVVARWQCDSACVIILMAADRRQALAGMDIGFHAVTSLIRRDDPVIQALADAQRVRVETYLAERGAPPSLMETARRLGPAQINRVPAETLLDLGVLTGLVDDQLEPLKAKR